MSAVPADEAVVPVGGTARMEWTRTALALLLRSACAGSPAQRAAEDANQLLRAGRAQEALVAYREAQRHSPEFADLHYGEGLALYNLERIDEAEAPIERAIRLDPEVADYHLYLGHIRGKLERREEAIEAYRESTRLAPIHPEGWKGLGLMLYNVGRYTEARAALERYLAFAPAARDRSAISSLVQSLPKESP